MALEDAAVTPLSRRYAALSHALLFQELKAPKKPIKPSVWDLETTATLEDIHCKIVEAFSAHDFDPRSEVWQAHADKIEIESEVPWLGSPFACSQVMDKDEFLRLAAVQSARMPDFKISCDSRTTTIDRKAGKARVTAYIQLKGHLQGVKLEGSCVSYFRWTDGKWLMYGVRLLHGIDPLGI